MKEQINLKERERRPYDEIQDNRHWACAGGVGFSQAGVSNRNRAGMVAF
jgi:hypothetical protein